MRECWAADSAARPSFRVIQARSKGRGGISLAAAQASERFHFRLLSKESHCPWPALSRPLRLHPSRSRNATPPPQSALAKHQRVSEWTDPATVSWVLKPQVGADGEVIADGRAAPAAAAVDDVLLSLSALAESPTPAPPVSRTSAELERRRTMVRAASRAHLRIPVLDDEEGKKKEPQCACSIQ